MAGLYFHIPFCRQACHYCNFHFSTSLSMKDALLNALVAELNVRHTEATGRIETVYFGGGTPSLLEPFEVDRLLHAVRDRLELDPEAEITLEANPDDITEPKLRALASAGVNRLSLGLQSFHDEDLRFMNRIHTASEARTALAQAMRYFENVSLDLIFGTPTMSHAMWEENLRLAVDSGVHHISAYALTVEERTALAHFIKTGKVKAVDETQTAEQFEMAMEMLTAAGYDHYEISNYCRPGFLSRHNSSYWNRTPYLGIGPSAHSFDGMTRSWNIANNAEYVRRINASVAHTKTSGEQLQYALAGIEVLTDVDQANELIMTGLRTTWGFDLRGLEPLLSKDQLDELTAGVAVMRSEGLLTFNDGHIELTRRGKLLADGIISRLMF